MALWGNLRWISNPILLLTIRLLFGAFFIFTGVLKLMEPRAEFEAVIRAYQIFPAAVIPWISLTLPWIELTVGTCLALGFLTTIAAWMAGATLLGFTLALGYTVVMGINLEDCGCFGSIGFKQSGSTAFIRNLILLTLYVPILLYPAQAWSLDAFLEKEHVNIDS
ncbi:MAG: DoxX family membrane protein [Nitrospirae bacterium]|nr:DoxX family membrane protein [Nitrospirota bacterium]